MMGKSDYKFMNRIHVTPFMACKFCATSYNMPELSFVLGNSEKNGKTCQMSFDKKIQEVLHLRQRCSNFQTTDDESIERDTTYPGSTFAPHDNNHLHLAKDSTDVYHNPYAPQYCINQIKTDEIVYEKPNSWDEALNVLFDRRRTTLFPSNKEVLRILNNSMIPTYTFKLGLPPQKGMGFDRGLWFYRSEKFNSTLDKNANTKREMKKLIMVYLYHVWFKKLPENKQDAYYLALDSSDKYSLGKDLSWWMLTVFKDAAALALYPEDNEYQIEFVRLCMLDRATEASMIANADCENSYELDKEVMAYEETIARYGYQSTYDGVIDKDGREILY